MVSHQKKVAIVRRYNKNISALKKELKHSGFVYSSGKPDFVISVGGDGTFFFAERKYPGIPKIMVRESHVCEKCNEGKLAELLLQYRKGYFILKEYFKLEAKVKRKKGKSFRTLACNDVILRNKTLTRALRFSVIINKKKVDGEIIGDGVVISSPFGSEAYFKSISHRSFTQGIGIAFNNTTKSFHHVVVKENSTICIEIIRESADLGFDNDPKIYTAKAGDVIEVKKSDNVARLIQIN